MHPLVEREQQLQTTEDLQTSNATVVKQAQSAAKVAPKPSHDAILHPEFICITPMGARVGRADYLKAWATGFDAERIPYYDYRDEKIDVFGDTALVRSTNKRVTAQDGGESVPSAVH